MPSAKPDKTLIKAALRERYNWDYPSDIFTPIQDAVLMAIAEGIITPSKAAQLEHTLLAYPQYDFFPYSILQKTLADALQPDGWTPAVERDLLVFLTYVFADDASGFAFQKLVNEDLPTMGDIFPQLFDQPADLTLAGRLCDFTGAFEGRSRRQCFAQVIELGGTPSDGGWYTDCFFVADDHFHKRAVSNGFDAAIRNRAKFGVTRIYRESAFR